MFETVRERLARLYPLHFQTIVERMHENWHYSTAELLLNSQATRFTLANVFTWSETEEGHTYWSNLSKGVEGDA